MHNRLIKTVTLLAFAALTTLAQAQETPARVGRISLSQGPVSISGEVGEETQAALVNWPVTSRNQISTGRSGRTEIRIGSTAIRLDADSALDIVDLDDDNVRLHLHYGSVIVRVRNEDAARGFELETPQGVVRLREPGRLRIDAGRVPETTAVNVFDGVAVVDDGGSSLTVRAGKRVEIYREDVRTSLAVRDSFDDWALLRDQRDDRATSDRYVTSEMTGYEELDQHGSWSDDSEYGPLWQPRGVSAGWVPYRDGRWTYLAPWGWTWVDNAPWGYAPFHYGRWVQVKQRWCWAPGRNIGRPVWAPALVGWIGGSNWNLAFSSGRRPAQGWYPLAPREHFVPGYRVSQDHLRHINRHARNDDKDGRRDHDHRRNGLTVVPHENFGRRGAIVVPYAPKAVVAPLTLQSAMVATPPVPAGVQRDGESRRFVRSDRRDERRDDRRDARRSERGGERRDDRNAGFQRPPMQGAQPVQVQPGAQPVQPAVPYSRRDDREGERNYDRNYDRNNDRNNDRNGDRFNERRNANNNNNNDDARRARLAPPQPQPVQQPQQFERSRERRQRDGDSNDAQGFSRPSAPVAVQQPAQLAPPVRQAPPLQLQPQMQPQPQVQAPPPPRPAAPPPQAAPQRNSEPPRSRRVDMREDKSERNTPFNQQ